MSESGVLTSKPGLASEQFSGRSGRHELDSRDIETLHQLCSAEASDSGPICQLANAIYRLHVRVLVLLIRIGRRLQ
jgi:hypothetical protein